MENRAQTAPDALLKLLARFLEEGVEYVLIGGQAVRLNGYLRATEDIDVLLRATRSNGEKVIRALSFLSSASELESRKAFSLGENSPRYGIRCDLRVV